MILNNYALAERKLRSVERSLRKDPAKQREYAVVVEKYLRNGGINKPPDGCEFSDGEIPSSINKTNLAPSAETDGGIVMGQNKKHLERELTLPIQDPSSQTKCRKYRSRYSSNAGGIEGIFQCTQLTGHSSGVQLKIVRTVD
ncbi:hypothetical protein T4E_2375 [Trichinella pseudospiralis]|uniref:Uncharacterized protein n=1 Tax=Trichinella pseudospiralis TaxID=6337 RepID=A0A0V0XJX3_TRIPS|nr:hypothetical protein T4E_2375 [Trichinella pseudospiralis]